MAELPAAVVAALGTAEPPVCAYVYDSAVLRATAQAVRAALPPGSQLLYAMKANGHPQVLAALAAVVDGFEVASGGELELARDAGAELIAFGGPAKTEAELSAAARAGAVIHVESVLEAYRLAALAATGHRPRVALRVNRAGVPLAGSHQMAGVPSQFGLDESDLATARDVLVKADIIGFHLHAVSNSRDAAAYAGYVSGALDWSIGAAERLGIGLRYVNVGGGLGLDYRTGERLDLGQLRSALPTPPPGVRLAFEPGRFLAAGAGWYAAQVLDIKQNQGRWFAVVRGGTHHFRLPAAWGYSHPFAVLPRDHWPHRYPRPGVSGATVTVAGELCTPRDVLGTQPVDRLRAGDIVVFGDAGAYGWEISHHDFLRHRYPQMLFI
jgi:diaminopimelate decarboxylase